MPEKSSLHIFCLWCAVSIAVCVLIFLIYEFVVKAIIAFCKVDEDSESVRSDFDNVVEAVREIQSDGLSLNNRFTLDMEVEEEDEEEVKSEVLIEDGRGRRKAPYVVKRIVVKPLEKSRPD